MDKMYGPCYIASYLAKIATYVCKLLMKGHGHMDSV